MERFDAIVVGAGPAGSAAALTLARQKFSVLLVERAKLVGQKNVFGGRVYAWPLPRLVPDWAEDCPVERYVTRENLVFLDGPASLTVAFENPSLGPGDAGSFTALRPDFDRWLAKKAEAAGAMLVTGIRVDDLWRDRGRVVGVVQDGDRVAADLVVVAEGIASQLVERAALRSPLTPGEVSVGVKETIELPEGAIEDRFGLGESEGAAYVYAGDAGGGCRGGGFLYTNKTTVSLGLVVSSEDLARKRVQVADVMDRFRRHPALARLLRDGKVIEYSAHMVPELGIRMMPRLSGDGVLVVGDAAGFLINNGYTFRGVDLAMASGWAAGMAAASARSAGGMSAAHLGSYERLLREVKVLDDLETFAEAPLYLKNPRLFDVYPRLLLEVAEKVYRVDGTGKDRIADVVLQTVKRRGSSLRLLLDLLGGARSM